MQNEKTDSTPLKTNGGSSRQAKGCCLLFASILVACIILVFAAIAGIIVVDSIQLRGEEYTFSQRVQRYKVACQFIWVDFKTWVSRKKTDEPPEENGSSF